MTRRPGYTLLEVLLALAIALLLMGGLYVAMDIQVRLAQAGRMRVDESTLARAVLARVAADVSATLTPIRSLANSGAGSGAGGTATPSTDTPPDTGAVTNLNAVTPFSGGVQGGGDVLVLFHSRTAGNSRVTSELDPAPNGGSDVRRVAYWIVDGGGLARQEISRVTADDQSTLLPPDVPDAESLVVSPEVTRLEFRYFDGSAWLDNWDGTLAGADGVTPVGPPRAVKISVEIRNPSDPNRSRTYHHVVAVQSANAPPPDPTTTTGTGP
jgi:prepilin-type N-terminal cleavage/methylation domain-containing protein